MSSVVEINNLHKAYGKTRALVGVSLDIDFGIFGLLGPNGAGKTTLLKVLLGLLKPDLGDVKLFGYDYSSQSLAIRNRIGYLGEDQRFYEYMKGDKYLEYIGLLKGLGKEEVQSQTEHLLKEVSLSKSRDKKIKEYSQGMKRRLGLAQALMGNPNIIMLDEPTSNLDPLGRQDFLNIIKEIGKNKTTIILSSNVLGEVELVCDTLALLNQGKVAYKGKWSDLKQSFPGKNLQDIFVEIISGENDE